MEVSNSFLVNSQKIQPLFGVSNIKESEPENVFSTIFDTAVSNVNLTNNYLSDAENEEIKLALGETDNTHDLAVALQKASATLQYTVAVRDKFMEAYKEIMQMQI